MNAIACASPRTPLDAGRTLEHDILNLLFAHRRLLADDPCANRPCPLCLAPHRTAA